MAIGNSINSKKITKTSGLVKEELVGYYKVGVNGTVTFRKQVESITISIFGSARFLTNTIVEKLHSKGTSSFNRLQANEMVNIGSLTLKEGTVKKVESKGYLSIQEGIISDSFIARGVVRAGVVKSNYMLLSMTGKCDIETIQSNHIEVSQENRGWSLTKKRLNCKTIVSKKIKLHSTTAPYIQGASIEIGPNCEIDELHYTDNYNIHPSSKVNSIIKM
ncbi:hypothetical protein [Ornithinibacillus scapharcae]|uniref:hypothetical protein n=1 Tax=Ornithinibacillus scapharcae TaxID=1147159 RepID=UPI000225BD65|nr:hypothetical protein [Ornithinibacillus scapharcae]